MTRLGAAKRGPEETTPRRPAPLIPVGTCVGDLLRRLNDPVGRDHIDNEDRAVKPVSGTDEIDVNDLNEHRQLESVSVP